MKEFSALIRLISVLLPLGAGSLQSEFIFERAPFASCHAPTIVELPNGDFLAAWFGGTAEREPDVAIWGARKIAEKWSEPFEMAREPNTATYNPVLFHSRDGTLWLYYKFGPRPNSWTGARRWSRDNGKTWSEIEHLPAGLYGPIKNKPVVLDDGAIVSGVSAESYLAWACWVERSTDNGQTWTKHGPIVARPAAFGDAQGQKAVRSPKPGATMSDEIYGVIQPTIAETGEGKLRMFVRSTRLIGKICYADSNDGGLTWADAKPTTLPNPNSGIDSITLRDGRILIVYNHSKDQRTPLNVAISRDGGNEWEPILALEDGPGEFSYPSAIQAANGDVHIVYTWNRKRIKHVVLDETALKEAQQ